MKRRKPRSRRGFRCESFLLGLNLVLLPVAARADIVADGSAPANQQPTVLNAGNGVPLVNIQTPSAAGVSRNTYSQFDVNSNGAILNNSRTDTQTQLGGWVQGNPQLATGSARVILNEVNANDPSRLNGYVEVAGSSAQVVIANPAGISCDGCGFINANRATLSTGTPILNNGALEGYRVDGGQIQINGAGLNAGSAGYTDLIGQAVQVNAGVWAQRLNVVAGAGQVNADASGIAANPSSEDVPVVAIDVSQLGGMYANSIHLVGTDAGVGVRNAGQIGAAAGEVVITADGRLENIGVVSAAQVQASANAISNGASGELNGQQLNLQASGDFENQGAIEAQYLKVDAGGTLNNRGLINSNTTQLRSDTLNNTGTGRIYGDTVAIGATTFNNVAQGDTAPVMAARERLDIGAQTINNQEHGLIYSSGDMAIGGSLDANNRAIGQADTLNNISATVQADGNLDLGIRTVNNINAHLTTDDVQVSSEFIHEYGGEGSPNRYSPAEISFVRHDQSRDLRTPDGVYSAWYEFQYQRTVTETQVVTSDPGQILAGGNLRLNTGTVTNDNSQILAGGDLTGT
ncbi:MAG TPA: filamentous hemagglutinin N-terminal domain-containing protein, partial [Dongiaceae bacterium]|nr:filamentous hemagglutinin N-terminal domain-containing protein [Dongiaceae bacterium]